MSKLNPVVSAECEIVIGEHRFKDDAAAYRYIDDETSKRDAINVNLREIVPVMFGRVARGVVNAKIKSTIRATFESFMRATHAKKFSEAQIKILSGLTDVPSDDIASLRF